MGEIQVLQKCNAHEVTYLMHIGFGQSLEFARNLFDSLSSKAVDNKNIGYGIIEDQNILGAILCAEQGTTKCGIKIINLHTLYAVETARGENILRLLRYAIKDLHEKEYAITIYTPTEKLQKFYGRIGFRYMNAYYVQQSLLSVIYLGIQNWRKKNSNLIKIGNGEKLNELNIRNTEMVSIKLKKERDVTLRIRNTHRKRRLFLGLRYKVVKIVAMSEKELEIMDFLFMILKLMIEKKSILVECSLFGEENNPFISILKGKKAPYMIALKGKGLMNIEELGSEVTFL